MLENDLKEQMREYLTMLQQPIELVAYPNASAKSAEMMELLQEIAALSSKITVTEGANATARTPSFALRKLNDSEQVVFAGLPLGHEFTSLVLALLQVGGHPSKLAPKLIAQVQRLTGDLQFETYFSLTCQNCPDVVQALNLMAVLNPNIKHTAIEGSVFPSEVEQRHIMTVPTVYLNGEPFAQGRMGVEEILAKVDSSSVEEKAQELSAKERFDVLVVGGGPAGAAAAIYTARKGLRTGVAAARFGGQVLDTMSIENFISVTETEGPKLAAALEEHVRSYDVDIMNSQAATALRKTDDGIEIELANGATLSGRTVILATGANWRSLNIPGEEEYRTKGVTYCPHCDGPFFKGKSVAVIGGGNSGAEAALDLAGVVKDVVLLEYGEKLRADAVLQEKLYSTANIRVLTKARSSSIVGDGSKVTALKYIDLTSGEEKTLELSGIFVQIGLTPNTKWLQGSGVELSSYGEIEVDAHARTSLPGVFAAGDVTTVPYKQIIIAMGEGSKAALSAFDYLIRN